MYQSSMLVLAVLSFVFLNVKAQVPPHQDGSSSQDVVSNFQPSLAVVIGILSIMFSITFLLLLYAKFCHRAASVHNSTNLQIQDGLVRSMSRSSGLDKTIVESLPFFRFSSLRGSREGLECAVCLSKIEDIEILRLLPKCKHAFHIDCIDQWLEKHATCPLCRYKVSGEDLSSMTYSNSFRFLWNDQNQSDLREESSLELYIQREENTQIGSSRFSIGSSFRISEKVSKEEELPIQEINDQNQENPQLHRFNHRIIMSDVVIKNRWSNVSSSDLMFLNSEMLNDMTSNRFSSMDRNNTHQQARATRVIEEEQSQLMNIKDEMGRKVLFERKFSKIKQNDLIPFQVCVPAALESRIGSESTSNLLSSNEKRCMSDIVVHSRFTDFNTKNGNREPFVPHSNVKEERRRRLWLPIARRTVQWFANREERRSAQAENRRQSHV